MSSLHIRGCHHVFFYFKGLCWVFWWNKKIKLCRYCHIVFDILLKNLFKKSMTYWPMCRINPHPMTNQPSRGDDSSRWETFFKRFYLHGYRSFMQTVYLTSWPRSCWICTYKILCCAINIKGVMMALPKPCRTNPALPYWCHTNSITQVVCVVVGPTMCHALMTS